MLYPVNNNKEKYKTIFYIKKLLLKPEIKKKCNF